MKRKIVSFLIILTLLLSCFSFSYADQDGIGIYIDGVKLQTTADPINQNGSIMVPMRDIFEAMGATVEWNSATKSITATKGLTYVKMAIDSSTMSINDSALQLNTAPMLRDNKTLVPVRAVAESFGAEVKWIGDSKTVEIISNVSGYPENYSVPDFGKEFKIKNVTRQENSNSSATLVLYRYNSKDFPADAMQNYLTKLRDNLGFTFLEAQEAADNGSLLYFKHPSQNLYVTAGRAGSEYIVTIALQLAQ